LNKDDLKGEKDTQTQEKAEEIDELFDFI